MGKKQWLILFLMMASAIFFWNVNCYAAEESEKDDISYTFNSETDTLSIHGSGEMTETPWLTDTAFKSYRKNVKNIIIEEGITSICSKACGFDHILSNLTSDIVYKNLFFTGMGKQIISALAPYSGNCFGLAATSALNFEGYLNLNKYFHNLPGSLADYGYNSILTNDEGKKYYSLQGNAEAINWVERMMVSQFSTALSKMEIYNSDLDKLITNLQEGVSFSIFVNMEYYLGGHTVVIDNRYKFSC